ncbi:hypothetical protein [Bacillus cereus]|uniref:hypothetical protein n=1 Tax=Bacillus cereus TaxID=1396 RepID=UPI000BF4F670|nr:hypothetical protein [Bacillus cereus]PEX83256.1 hypothetical protein CN450_20710 [Bacillus cereus]
MKSSYKITLIFTLILSIVAIGLSVFTIYKIDNKFAADENKNKNNENENIAILGDSVDGELKSWKILKPKDSRDGTIIIKDSNGLTYKVKHNIVSASGAHSSNSFSLKVHNFAGDRHISGSLSLWLTDDEYKKFNKEYNKNFKEDIEGPIER